MTIPRPSRPTPPPIPLTMAGCSVWGICMMYYIVCTASLIICVCCVCRISNPDDSTLDEMMKNMYQDPDILEQKCKVQGYGGGGDTKSRLASHYMLDT